MSQTAHCWDKEGYYSHDEPCTIDPLESEKAGNPVYVIPARGCLQKPDVVPGKIARRIDGAWIQEANHKGKTGYINRIPHTIDKYGPLPEGFSETLPPLTETELFTQLRAIRDGRLAATDKYFVPDFPITAENLAEVKAYRQALRDLPAREGAPWDGGGDETPWPGKPEV